MVPGGRAGGLAVTLPPARLVLAIRQKTPCHSFWQVVVFLVFLKSIFFISGISKEHFLDSIFVSQKMVTANSSKPGTCQKLRQGVPPRIFEPEFLYIAVEICGREL